MSNQLARYITSAVPRYTSYPTAPHFSDRTDARAYEEWLNRMEPGQSVSLYLHVPFCRQLCWYCGCNMKLASKEAPVAAYAKTLRKEIALLASKMPHRAKISHLHWGGGTPTAMLPTDLEACMATVSKHFDFAENAEVAIECDPRTLTREMTRTIGKLGFTRASFGVQEFDPKVQKSINRVQPPEMVAAAVENLRAAGVEGINFDLIYGLPHQTIDTLQNTVALAAEMRPDRFALFGYAHVPWMAKKQRLIDAEALPGASERVAQAEAAADAFADAGYQAIGLDHFARPGDSLANAAQNGTLRRNFQGYTTDTAEYLLGVGASSIGKTPSGFAQNTVETGAWARSVEAGELPIAEGLAFSGEDLPRAAVIEQLMCLGSVDLDRIAQRFGLSDDWCSRELNDLVQFETDGLVAMNGKHVQVTGKGRPLVRTVAAVFDTYLAQNAARHSVAV